MYYCSFVLRSDKDDASTLVFKRATLSMLEFEDNRSAVNLARAERWRNKAGTRLVFREDLPRYNWLLTSKEAVGADESDAYAHASWLLSQLKADVSIPELMTQGMEFGLSFYWGGGGTGGGPVVTPRLGKV